MKAPTRMKPIPGRATKGARGKAQSKSKAGKLSGTQAGSQKPTAALGPDSRPQSSTPATRTRKPGAKPPSSSQPGSGSKIRPDIPSWPAAVRFPVVGVGASAGGLEAFTQLLQHLPGDTGMGFVLVQHLDPAHASALPQLLTRVTSMPVHEVSNKMPVQPNHVYVIPPNTAMAIAHGRLKLQPRPERSGAHRSIDFFFESLAQDQCERAIGVILSGTASDGTLGLEAIKAEAGITIAQDDSAKYDSMPRSAIAAGCVDFVLSPEEIAKELMHIARHPYVVADAPRPPEGIEQAETPLPARRRGRLRSESRAGPGEGEQIGFKKILLLLRKHSNLDFSRYKVSTIQRRIQRRMVLTKLTTQEAYAQMLRGNAEELEALYSDLLISVTSFFRNPEAFEVLKRSVFPELIRDRRDDRLRVWVLGCSTGQEAYSLAMAFTEFSDRVAHSHKFQVFATDVNQGGDDLHPDLAQAQVRRTLHTTGRGLQFSEPKTRRSRRAVALPGILRPYLERARSQQGCDL